MFDLNSVHGVARSNIAFESRVSKSGRFLSPRITAGMRRRLNSSVTVTFSRYVPCPTSRSCTGHSATHAAH